MGLGREGLGSPRLHRAAHLSSTELRGGVRRGRCGELEGEGGVCVGWGGEEDMSVPNTRLEASGAEELCSAGLAARTGLSTRWFYFKIYRAFLVELLQGKLKKNKMQVG